MKKKVASDTSKREKRDILATKRGDHHIAGARKDTKGKSCRRTCPSSRGKGGGKDTKILNLRKSIQNAP